MKRIALLCLVFFFAYVGPLWAAADMGCTVENDYGRRYTGTLLDSADGLVIFNMGQAIAGEVVHPPTLSRHGLKGVKNGDAIEATWLGGQKFRLLHTASGKSVTILFQKDKVKQK